MNRRTLRMRKLVGLLECGDLLQVKSIAEQLEVSIDSIFRDLDGLRGEGYRIDTARGRGGGVMLRREKGA